MTTGDHTACDFANKLVTCDRCDRTYTCSEWDDYYCAAEGDHCCEPCLLRGHGFTQYMVLEPESAP